MLIKRIPLSQIRAAAYNPRKDLQPGDPEYEKLKRSIERFDMVEPLVWNRRTKNLVGGHQRLKVLRAMGVKHVEVSVVSLNDDDEKALNVALNKISGDWDLGKLKGLLEGLDKGGYDISLTGFDEKELRSVMDYGGKPGLTDDDAAPEPPAKPKTKLGDVYDLGTHRLLCGDATKRDDVQVLMDDLLADMVFTDPPYNVDYEGRTDKKLKIQNDKMSAEDFDAFLLGTFTSYRRASKDGASLYVCHASQFQREFQNAIEAGGFAVRCQIIWAKNHYGWGFARYKFQHEPIFYAYVKGQSDPWYGDKTQSTVWNEAKPVANRLHPTMKPVELILRALANSSKAGDIVLDLFGGSGSTLIGCEKMGRRCFTMELDPAYCDVIVKRWEDFTGKKATKREVALASHL